MALLKTASSRTTGFSAERRAEHFLKSRGVTIIAQQYQSRFGEIDLIGTHQQTLIFVEVRFRKNNHYGSPAETVNTAKQQKIIKTAQLFLMKNSQFQPYYCRFDVVGVNPHNGGYAFNWIQGAFT
jgi:putative endonuclease